MLLCSVKMAYVRISAANTIKQKYNRRRASAPVTAHHTVVKVRHQMHKAEGPGCLIMEFLTICSQRQNWIKLVILCVFLCIAIKKKSLKTLLQKCIQCTIFNLVIHWIHFFDMHWKGGFQWIIFIVIHGNTHKITNFNQKVFGNR